MCFVVKDVYEMIVKNSVSLLFKDVLQNIRVFVQKAPSIKIQEGICIGLVKENRTNWMRKPNTTFIHSDLNLFESKCAYWFLFSRVLHVDWDWHRISIINGKTYLCCQSFISENYRLIPFPENHFEKNIFTNKTLYNKIGCWGKIRQEFISHRL